MVYKAVKYQKEQARPRERAAVRNTTATSATPMISCIKSEKKEPAALVPKNTRPVACTMTSASESTTTRNVLRDPDILSISMLPLGSVAGITLVRPTDYLWEAGVLIS